MYHVKEIYFTLQGEGAQAGRAAVFCRFSGCNLWSGKEADRDTAKCWFCDTDFVGTDGPGGGKFRSAEELAAAIAARWPKGAGGSPCVVFTGGEPLLQLDLQLLDSVRERGLQIAVETNGTIAAPERGIDWLTVSPKPASPLVQRHGSELKLVYPQEIEPAEVNALSFEYFFLSPLHSEDREETARNLREAIAYCKTHPQWRLTMQYHKIWSIP